MIRSRISAGLPLLAILALPFCGPARADFAASGLVDVVVAADNTDNRALNRIRTGASAFDPVHTRLFFEGGRGRTRAFVQVLLRDTSATPIRLFGAYLMHQVVEGRQFYVQAGKIPTPQGTWGPRNYSDKNPLIGAPFAYTWPTTLPGGSVPADLGTLVGSAGSGANSSTGTTQMLVLYENCWHDGVAVLGVERGIEYQLAVTLGSPGKPITGVDDNDDIALHARIGYAPIPEIVLRASWGRGAYLPRTAAASLPPGQSVNDYVQQLWMGSVEISRGRWILHGEFIHNTFETPLTDDNLTLTTGYADLTWKFAVGWFAAARVDALRFGDVTLDDRSVAWDQDVDRLEVGIGHRLSRDFTLKAVAQFNRFADGGVNSDEEILATQAVLKF